MVTATKKISKAYTKAEFLNTLSKRTELTKKEIGRVLNEIEVIIAGHLKKDAAGKFVLPGLLKISVKKVPAKKARKGRNPATGEIIMLKAKPPSEKVKVVPLKNLKEMAT
jgi:nucleoid DNA-binding protein